MRKYLGLEALDPFAGIVEAAIHQLDQQGQEVARDSIRMMQKDGRSFDSLPLAHRKVVAYLYAVGWKGAHTHRMLADDCMQSVKAQVASFLKETGTNCLQVDGLVTIKIEDDGSVSAIPGGN